MTPADYLRLAETCVANGEFAAATAYAALASVPATVVADVREAEKRRERWGVRTHRAAMRALVRKG